MPGRARTEAGAPRRRSAASDGRRVSLAAGAYERLRDAIVRGEFRPNERLVEAELAEWLNVSRTPLRESLARLAAEGLVTSRRRGWVVREHTPEEISEIYEVRAALEGMAAFLAAARATDEQIAHIAELEGVAEPELIEAPRTRLVEVNDAFHDAIVEASGNERLRHLVRQNREFFFNYRIAAIYTEEEALASIEGHDEIVRALQARDSRAAEQAMVRHILEARDVTLSKLR
ncbi:MAG: GntR family transcriptional regulator [Thermoleophilaceae bacterium]|nr:GntR family transcriptional regulator [Thermoleophilaceae bacterium]